MHITASVFINDNESGLHADFEAWLERLAPEKPHSQYHHNGAEDNADAHLKRSVMGREVVVAVSKSRLDFGPWEQIFYGEFDGKRDKRVLVKIVGEEPPLSHFPPAQYKSIKKGWLPSSATGYRSSLEMRTRRSPKKLRVT
jgi:secondary thiamine-phosphate synthase enzyme